MTNRTALANTASNECARQKRRLKKLLVCFAVSLCFTVLFAVTAFAAQTGVASAITPDTASTVVGTPAVQVQMNGDDMQLIDVMTMLTLMALIPSIVIMATSFTRILIVLSFLRNAIGLQQTPPNQVLIGLALFLSLAIMTPVISQINEEAYQPYTNKQITQEEAFSRAQVPLKSFMLKNTKAPDLQMFCEFAKITEKPENPEDLPITVIIPSFLTSELRRAFLMGFLIFLPFLVIDMVVASTLMSMGMIMLPPVMISLPFKLLLFVLVDGWTQLFHSLVASFIT